MKIRGVEILVGDAIERLKDLEPESVQCCVTSPPYWGLRDYGVEGQIGLEKTPDLYVEKMVSVFREVWRVLKNDGVLWVNLGDCYAGSGRAAGDKNPNNKGNLESKVAASRQNREISKSKRIDRGAGRWGSGNNPATGISKSKDMLGIPWRVAFALQADGWYLRSDIIWNKPNPMPESVNDRPTRCHEYIFLLSKSKSYFYDAEAILEPCSENTHARISQNLMAQVGSERANGGAKTNGNMKAVFRKGKTGSDQPMVKNNESFAAGTCMPVVRRNKRTVWTVPTYGFKDAHFATYPPELIRPCIRAGSRRGDVILDPFGGSGTTGQVALEEGRNAVLIELNPNYLPLINRRTGVQIGMGLI